MHPQPPPLPLAITAPSQGPSLDPLLQLLPRRFLKPDAQQGPSSWVGGSILPYRLPGHQEGGARPLTSESPWASICASSRVRAAASRPQWPGCQRLVGELMFS